MFQVEIGVAVKRGYYLTLARRAGQVNAGIH